MSIPTYDEVRRSYQVSYDLESKQKTFHQYVLPYNTFGYTLLIAYLQFSCYPAVRRLRYLVVLTICALSLHMLLYSRTLGFAYGLGVGPNAIWASILALTLIVFRKPHQDCKRLVRQNLDVGISHLSWILNRFNGAESIQSNGSATNSKNLTSPSNEVMAPTGFEWESMPEDFWRRIIWVQDLIFSFRQPHWKWRSGETVNGTSSIRLGGYPSLASSLTRFTLAYLVIDLLKTIMLTDPYFLSLGSASNPSWLPSPHGFTDYLVIRTVRSIVSYAGIFTALNFQFELTNLVSYHILPLGTILGDSSIPELYEPLFGPFSSVLNDGLLAFWSRYWHGLLRFSFVSAGSWIATQLGYKERSAQAKIAIVITAFMISGYGHGVAAYTLWGNRYRPFFQAFKAFAFFAIQPLGIALQAWLLPRSSAIKEGKRLPASSTRKVTNVLFVMAWLWLTCPLLIDPLADGGNWLMEPLPISFVRGLGFSRDKRWWCWPTDIPAKLVWNEQRWWLSGLEIL